MFLKSHFRENLKIKARWTHLIARVLASYWPNRRRSEIKTRRIAIENESPRNSKIKNQKSRQIIFQNIFNPDNFVIRDACVFDVIARRPRWPEGSSLMDGKFMRHSSLDFEDGNAMLDFKSCDCMRPTQSTGTRLRDAIIDLMETAR